MKSIFKISTNTLTLLSKEVRSLSSVITSKPLLPILDNFLFKFSSKELTIVASDQQTTVISKLILDVNSSEESSIAIPARMLKDTLSNLPKQPLTIEVDNMRYQVSLITSSGCYQIACENGSDFPTPEIGEEESKVCIDIPILMLQNLIRKTLFATSKDDLRPELSGIYLSITNNELTWVATDGHRLVCYKNKSLSSNKSIQCIIPSRSLKLLEQLLFSHPAKDVSVSIQKKIICFSWGTIEVMISLINESYPDYEHVIPKKNPNALKLNTDCLHVFERIGVYANKATKQLRMKLGNNKLKIIAEDQDFSNSAYEQVACHYEGMEMEIGFNAKLITEMFASLPSNQEVELTFDTPNRAVMILPNKSNEDEQLRMLIMPIKIT